MKEDGVDDGVERGGIGDEGGLYAECRGDLVREGDFGAGQFAVGVPMEGREVKARDGNAQNAGLAHRLEVAAGRLLAQGRRRWNGKREQKCQERKIGSAQYGLASQHQAQMHPFP